MIEEAIKHLKENGIEAFEGAGIVIIPASSPEEIYDLAGRVRKIFKECGYTKSWQIDPYYYDRQSSLSKEMFG